MKIWEAGSMWNETLVLMRQSTIYMKDCHQTNDYYQWPTGNFSEKMLIGGKEEDSEKKLSGHDKRRQSWKHMRK